MIRPYVRVCLLKKWLNIIYKTPVSKNQFIVIIVNAPVDIYIIMLFCRNMPGTDDFLTELADEVANVMQTDVNLKNAIKLLKEKVLTIVKTDQR